jgi:hypothetical protein
MEIIHPHGFVFKIGIKFNITFIRALKRGNGYQTQAKQAQNKKNSFFHGTPPAQFNILQKIS